MSEKKVVSRNVAITLGIICTILIVGLVGAIASYTSIISGKDDTIASKDSQISSLNSQIIYLNSKVSDLTDTVNLGKSTVWVNNQIINQSVWGYTYVKTFSTSYAGYISVDVLSSTPTNKYVEVIWSAYGISYDSGHITVGTNGTAYFPMMPSSNIIITIGNTVLLNATETVTITYYY